MPVINPILVKRGEQKPKYNATVEKVDNVIVGMTSIDVGSTDSSELEESPYIYNEELTYVTKIDSTKWTGNNSLYLYTAIGLKELFNSLENDEFSVGDVYVINGMPAVYHGYDEIEGTDYNGHIFGHLSDVSIFISGFQGIVWFCIGDFEEEGIPGKYAIGTYFDTPPYFKIEHSIKTSLLFEDELTFVTAQDFGVGEDVRLHTSNNVGILYNKIVNGDFEVGKSYFINNKRVTYNGYEDDAGIGIYTFGTPDFGKIENSTWYAIGDLSAMSFPGNYAIGTFHQASEITIEIKSLFNEGLTFVTTQDFGVSEDVNLYTCNGIEILFNSLENGDFEIGRMYIINGIPAIYNGKEDLMNTGIYAHSFGYVDTSFISDLVWVAIADLSAMSFPGDYAIGAFQSLDTLNIEDYNNTPYNIYDEEIEYDTEIDFGLSFTPKIKLYTANNIKNIVDKAKTGYFEIGKSYWINGWFSKYNGPITTLDWEVSPDTIPITLYTFGNFRDALVWDDKWVAFGDFSEIDGLSGYRIALVGHNSDLTKLRIEDDKVGKLEIGTGAFSIGYGIKEIKFNNNITKIRDGAFAYLMMYNGRLDLPNKLVDIGDGAFYNFGVPSNGIVIPNSVKRIGDQAFYGVGVDVLSIDVTIGDGVEIIGYKAFGDYSLNYNGVLTIGNNVRIISDYAFYNWGANLNPIVLPSTIEQIGNNAFSFWGNVPYVVVNAIIPPELGFDAFSYQNNAPIYVPDESVNAYKSATNWNSLSARIKGISEMP